MWLTSACPSVGRHSGCAMRCPRVNRIVTSTGSGAIERGGIMQPLLESPDKTLRGGEM